MTSFVEHVVNGHLSPGFAAAQRTLYANASPKVQAFCDRLVSIPWEKIPFKIEPSVEILQKLGQGSALTAVSLRLSLVGSHGQEIHETFSTSIDRIESADQPQADAAAASALQALIAKCCASLGLTAPVSAHRP